MTATIRIEFVPVLGFGLDGLNASHLHLVFQPSNSTEDQQHEWFVIEGVVNSGQDTLGVEGGSGALTLADANNAATPEELVDKIGTPSSRGSRILPFNSAETAWLDITLNGRQIDLQELPYKAFGQSAGTATINSTSVIASLLYYAGLNINDHLPAGIGRSPGRTTLVGRPVGEEMRIVEDFTNLFGGKGDDIFFGTDSSSTEKFFGGQDNDIFRFSGGPDVYHGGHEGLDYENDGIDTVDYTDVNQAIILKSDVSIAHNLPDYIVKTPEGDDKFFSIERIQWGDKKDTIEFGPGVDVIEDGIYIDLRGADAPEGDEFSLINESTNLVINRSTQTALWIQAESVTDNKLGIYLESAETIISGKGDDRIYVSEGLVRVDGGEGDDLIDARFAEAFSENSPEGYDIELLGGSGDDTLVSGAGKTFADGGDGQDTFILSALSQSGGDTVEFVIDGADNRDELFIPYNFLYSETSGTFEGSPLFQVKGAGDEADILADFGNVPNTSMSFEWLTGEQLIGTFNTVEGLIDFSSSIIFEMSNSDLIISVIPGTVTQQDLYDENGDLIDTAVFSLLDQERQTIIRVLDFQPGDLGINFYDIGDAVDIEVNGNFGTTYENWDQVVETLTNNGQLDAAFDDVRPDAPESDPNGYDDPESGGSSENPTEHIVGTIADDIITAVGVGRNNIDGGDGDDTITGGSQNDTLDGGAGDDQLSGGDGNDSYNVDSAGDTVIELAGGGSDTVTSSVSYGLDLNIENLILAGNALTGTGNSENNLLLGNAEANTLLGLAGNDTLIGGANNDTLSGGVGSDTYIFNTGDGNDTIQDSGAAQDFDRLVIGGGLTANDLNFVRLSSSPDDITIQLSSGESIVVEQQLLGASYGIDEIEFSNGDTLDRSEIDLLSNAAAVVANDPPIAVDDFPFAVSETTGVVFAQTLLQNDSDANGDTLSVVSVQDVVGGTAILNIDGNIDITADENGDGVVDFIYTISDGNGGTSTALATVIVTPADDAPTVEIVNGTNSADVISGTPDDDVIYAEQGSDIINGGDGSDILNGGAGADELNGGADRDYLFGGNGIDLLNGDNGDDSLDGGSGDDVLNGGTGNDTLLGGNQNDTLNGESGNDTLNGGFGADILNGGIGLDILNGDNGNDELNGGDNDDILSGGNGADLLNGDAGADNLDGGSGDDVLNGGDGNDTLAGGNQADTLNGDAGNDTLNGGFGADILNGGIGLDILNGDNGNDTLNGGDNDDILSGGNGADLLNGDAGADNLDGGSGDDVLNGGDGNDTLAGGNQADTLNGDAGNDTLNGGFGADILNGGIGLDILNGDNGNDELNGGNDDDNLSGGNGSDVLNGDAGSDHLDGGSGYDTLNGGDGDDTLDGGRQDDFLNGGTGNDVLTGGNGDDRFVFAANFGHDEITDFQDTASVNDVLEFSNTLFADYVDLMAAASQIGSDVVISLDQDNSVTLRNTQLGTLDEADFSFVA